MRSKTTTILVVVMVLCISGLPTFGTIHYNDGGTYNISTTVNDNISVNWQDPSLGTTVNLLDNGYVNSLFGYQHSYLNILGGSVSGGLGTHYNAQLTMSSGSAEHDLYANDSSQVTISGGSIGFHLFAYDDSQVTMSGGTVGLKLWAGYHLSENTNSILTIIGSNFAINGISVDYGQYTASDYTSGHIMGTLASGDLLNNDFEIHHNSSIVLVPEPATVLLLSLGTVVLRRKTSKNNK